MRVHHLNCATLCTLAPPLLGAPAGCPGLVCHCLAIETDAGIVLVDTGLGVDDVRSTRARVGRGFPMLLRPALDERETALRRIGGLGLRAADVRHIVLTHLDVDHAGGLSDFPQATVHVMHQEHEAAMGRATTRERRRYRPAQWAHRPKFEVYRARGERWLGFEKVGELRGLPPEILLIPLFGHTRGHAGVAVRTDTGWLLHAGDAYFHRCEMEGAEPPRVLAWVQRADDMDHAARMNNQARLRALVRSGGARVFCAHDPAELAGLQEAG